MQDRETGEMVHVPEDAARVVDARRRNAGSPLMQLGMAGLSIPVGRQGPVFFLGEKIEVMSTVRGRGETGIPEGFRAEFAVDRIFQKGLMLLFNARNGGDARSLFRPGQMIELRGGMFRIESVGISRLILRGVPGTKVRQGE